MSVAGLLTIRILTQALGTEQYAAYAIFVGLQGWFLLADFGIGSSLQNHISEKRALGESYEPVIAAASIVLFFLLTLCLAGLVIISPHVAPIILKGFPFLAAGEKSQCLVYFGVFAIIASLSGVTCRIWFAEQRGYLANGLPAMSSVITLLLVIWVRRSELHDQLFWSLIVTVAPLTFLQLPVLLFRGISCLRIAGGKWKVSLLPLIIRAGKFWGFALMATVVLQLDYVVMSQFLSAGEIVVYNFTMKFFTIIYFVYYALLQALWPVCAELIARQEWAQVKRHLRRNIIIGAGVIVVGVTALSVLKEPLVNLLSPREQIVLPLRFILLTGGYYLLRVWSDTFTMILQSMSYLRPFWLIVPFQALISAATQWSLAPRYGVYGIITGISISFALTVVWALPWALRQKMQQKIGKNI